MFLALLRRRLRNDCGQCGPLRPLRIVRRRLGTQLLSSSTCNNCGDCGSCGDCNSCDSCGSGWCWPIPASGSKARIATTAAIVPTAAADRCTSAIGLAIRRRAIPAIAAVTITAAMIHGRVIRCRPAAVHCRCTVDLSKAARSMAFNMRAKSQSRYLNDRKGKSEKRTARSQQRSGGQSAAVQQSAVLRQSEFEHKIVCDAVEKQFRHIVRKHAIR